MPVCFLISVDSASILLDCFLKMLECFLISIYHVFISVDSANKRAFCFLKTLECFLIFIFSAFSCFGLKFFPWDCLLPYPIDTSLLTWYTSPQKGVGNANCDRIRRTTPLTIQNSKFFAPRHVGAASCREVKRVSGFYLNPDKN